MASEPDNLILKILREMRADMSNRFDELDRKFADVDARFDGTDRRLDSLREAMHGESVLSRYATAEFDDRFEKIERRLDAIERERRS
jgi:hypothetical protein